ncbi:MAG: hypothetical protein DI565_05550 [Ancylobacter novellus]|uniref:Uncharacterized protein n=1 Tax=Ancylobacter novellus TaxID=921 RepID=A0A2W5KM80_ANCNO|nr:MAG: hypothetical protein DI565_05550 [Ancylobacter novellus]
MAVDADLAVVSSPLQYMNAVEWRASRAGTACDLVLIGDRHGAGGMIDLLMRRRAPWRRVIRHGRRPRPPRAVPRFLRDLLDAAHRVSLERLAAVLAGAPRGAVAFGDYRNVSQRLIVDRIGAQETVLLDDGSVTPQAAAFRADPANAPEPRQFDLAWFRTAAARRLFGDPLLPEPERLTFFTIYGPLLEGRLRASDRLAQNDYSSWRAAAGDAPRGASAWLIGADHAEAGICAHADYRALALGAAQRLREEGRRPVIYRPHRGEDVRKAAEIAEAGRMTLGVSTAPAELDYLDAAERPATVAVVASSVADTLAVLDPELDLARIAPPPAYLRKRADHIRAVIAAHDAFNQSLRVIHLDRPSSFAIGGAP